MEIKRWFWTVVSCLALTLWAMPAAAAPISGVTTEPKLRWTANSIVATTHWRRRYAYYYSEYSSDNFDRYYPYDEPTTVIIPMATQAITTITLIHAMAITATITVTIGTIVAGSTVTAGIIRPNHGDVGARGILNLKRLQSFGI